jgi:uncharacterized protein YndB with AHSA1/START domain
MCSCGKVSKIKAGPLTGRRPIPAIRGCGCGIVLKTPPYCRFFPVRGSCLSRIFVWLNKSLQIKISGNMGTDKKTRITVEQTIQAPLEKVWAYWSDPGHIQKWNNASDDWHTTRAENDLRPGGKFLSRMEAKDGSAGFDFTGTYDAVKPFEYIGYTISDGRKVEVRFSSSGNGTRVVERFEAESIHTPEMQRGGWQSILDHFRQYTEAN